MPTIVRRRKLGLKSIKGIIAASTRPDLTYANNYEVIPEDNVYFRWGCTTNLPNPKHAKVLNSAAAIHRVADKSGFRRVLHFWNLCPKTWWSIDAAGPMGDGRKVIVRSKTHAQGRGLWVCETDDDVVEAVDQAGPGNYINELIDKVAEYRVFVMQNKVVWVAKKTPGNPQDVAWNVAKGGRFDNCRWDDWPKEVVEAAVMAHALTGLHFSGIDVMVDADGKAYVLEANSAPSQTSPYRQSCVAKAFDYTIQHHDYDIPPFKRTPVTGWRDVIHPAIWRKR